VLLSEAFVTFKSAGACFPPQRSPIGRSGQERRISRGGIAGAETARSRERFVVGFVVGARGSLREAERVVVGAGGLLPSMGLP
jgi:hypothetical protein